MVLLGGLAFGIVVGYISWHTIRPGEPNSALDIKKLVAFIGAVGGAVVISLFPAGTDLFGAYGLGLALGFFSTPVEKTLNQSMFSYRRGKVRGRAREQKEVQKEFESAEKWIFSNLPTLTMSIHAKFSGFDGISRERITIADLEEFPVPMLTKIQVLRVYAMLFPDLFSFDIKGLHRRTLIGSTEIKQRLLDFVREGLGSKPTFAPSIPLGEKEDEQEQAQRPDSQETDQ